MGQEHDDYGETGYQPRRRGLKRLGIVFGLLLVAYGVSYVVFLSPGESANGGLHRMVMRRYPAYRGGGAFTATVFRPALWVDHRVRPDYWDTREVMAPLQP